MSLRSIERRKASHHHRATSPVCVTFNKRVCDIPRVTHHMHDTHGMKSDVNVLSATFRH